MVLDTSVALEILLRTPLGERCNARLLNDDLHAPHLIDLEFANALRRLVRFGGLDRDIARDALDDFRNWKIARHLHTPLLLRIWELRDSLSGYDASYVVLAEALGAPLVTADAKLSRSHGHRADIVLLT